MAILASIKLRLADNQVLLIKYLKSGGSLIPQSLINAAVTKNSASLGVDGIQVFRDTFKAAGKDPIMQEVQQDFFVKNFLTRAEDYAKSLNLTEPLSILVVLDSLVQGSFSRVSSLVPKFYQDTQNPLNEWDWVRSYLNTRYKWLATNPNTALNPTADRVQSLIDIEKSDNWKLNLPLTLSTKGITITDSDVI